MKKRKQYLAIAAVILLAGMYVMTLIFALSAHPAAKVLFEICFYCTIMVPVLLYAMILVYRNLQKKNQEMFDQTIDTVIFDVGNVLVDYDWQRYLERLGYDEEKKNVFRDAVFEHPLWEEADRGVLTDEELKAGFLKNCEGYEEEFLQVYRGLGDTITPLAYACDWIRDLKKRGLRVYILSNYSHYLYEETKGKMAFLPLVDGALFSYSCHMIKPEPAVYEELMRRYDIRPKCAVFVDDRPVNTEGAKRVGLKTLCFTDYMDTKQRLDQILATK